MKLIQDQCFACDQGFPCGSEGSSLTKEQREELEYVLTYTHLPFMWLPSECDLDYTYNLYKGWYEHIPFLKKYEDKIKRLFEWQDDTYNVEGFQLDLHEGEVELFWMWEDYNGLYCTDGTMKALWKGEEEDETWSKSETDSLCEEFNTEAKNFKEFIDKIKI